MWFQMISFLILSIQQPAFAILEVFWVMLQVKMPKAYKVLLSLLCFHKGMKTANCTATAQFNAEDKTNLSLLLTGAGISAWVESSLDSKPITTITCAIKNGIPILFS